MSFDHCLLVDEASLQAVLLLATSIPKLYPNIVIVIIIVILIAIGTVIIASIVVLKLVIIVIHSNKQWGRLKARAVSCTCSLAACESPHTCTLPNLKS